MDAGIKFCFYNVNSFLEKTAFERVASWGIIKNCDAVNKDNAKLRNATHAGVAEFLLEYQWIFGRVMLQKSDAILMMYPTKTVDFKAFHAIFW